MQHLPINTLLQGGKYRIVRFIDSGGFGCTYEAEHVMLENRVAIKEFFVKDFCNRDESTAHVSVSTQSKKGLVDKLRRKFVNEARAICRLHHPGIVTVSDVFEENGTAYFVMDYIEGRSLKEVIDQQGKLSEKKALHYIRQVADALQYVHEHNRLHLDVKPGNIMVGGADRAILIDFGASKQYDEQDGENTSTLMGKTPGYAPLEQMGNDVVKFMPATDIYSLGATLYKLLTGTTPPSASLLASGEELPPLPANISTPTRQALAAAMQTNKNKRPQSVAEFIALLNGEEDTTIVGEETVMIPKPTPQPKPKPKPIPAPSPSPWKRWAVPLVMGFIAALAVIFWPKGEDENSGNGGNINLDTLTQQTSSRSFGTGTINGRNYVDLGLSVKWADRNVGASSPSDYGSYFAWGETSTKSDYSSSTCKTWEVNLGDIAGNSRYDAARANWGGTWRLPTKAECEELNKNCTWTWTTQGGHYGYKVVGPNGNSIFLPAAGWRYGTSLSYAGEYGYYWSSTPYESYAQGAYSLSFNSSNHYVCWYYRGGGRSVRPVSE